MPWRDYQRLYEQKIFKKILFSTLFLVIGIVLSGHFFLARYTKHLEIYIEKLNWEIKNLSLTGKMANQSRSPAFSEGKIKEWIEGQEIMRKLFYSLGTIKQADVCFTKITRHQSNIFFSGTTDSPDHLTIFLLHAPFASLFSEITIDEVKKENDHIQFRFHAKAMSGSFH